MYCKLHFLSGNSKHIQNYYFEKEYRDDVIVELDNLFYEVNFFTLESLNYEGNQNGFGLPGIIILDEITDEKIVLAVKNLITIKYFDFFKGETQLNLYKNSLNMWYLNGPFIFKKEDIVTRQI